MTLDELWSEAAEHIHTRTRGTNLALLVLAGEVRSLREHLANPPQTVQQQSDVERESWGRTFDST
jgi:hypothetical protein